MTCCVWRNIYRKAVIDKFGLKFESERDLISEDILFNCEFYYNCQCAVIINRSFYHYVKNETSLTNVYRPDRFEKERIF